MAEKKEWPAWRHGPKGESAVFETEKAVPDGWTAHRQEQGTNELEARRQEQGAAEQGELRAENEHLRAENDELRQRIEALESSAQHSRAVDSNGDGYGSVREIKEALESGAVTPEQVADAESQRENPRATVLSMVDKQAAAQPKKAQKGHRAETSPFDLGDDDLPSVKE